MQKRVLADVVLTLPRIVLLFLTLLAPAVAVAPNHAPNWGGGRSDVSYDVVDDIGKPYSNRFSHTDPNCKYSYCQRGVKLDKKKAADGLCPRPMLCHFFGSAVPI